MSKKMKTLKDIEEWCCGMGEYCKYDDSDSFDNTNQVHSMDLRKEAIKWVKDMPEDDGKGTNFREWNGVFTWIKHFFNLSEEDLK